MWLLNICATSLITTGNLFLKISSQGTIVACTFLDEDVNVNHTLENRQMTGLSCTKKLHKTSALCQCVAILALFIWKNAEHIVIVTVNLSFPIKMRSWRSNVRLEGFQMWRSCSFSAETVSGDWLLTVWTLHSLGNLRWFFCWIIRNKVEWISSNVLHRVHKSQCSQWWLSVSGWVTKSSNNKELACTVCNI